MAILTTLLLRELHATSLDDLRNYFYFTAQLPGGPIQNPVGRRLRGRGGVRRRRLYVPGSGPRFRQGRLGKYRNIAGW